ncbi:head-tail connector protein [Jiella sp. LLJ827]|nr:head-tail connector protein [Jiella sp. LLJ827]
MPVSLAEAKRHLRVDHDDDDDMITAMIETATARLDGYSGVLGRAIVSQAWRETFDGFCRVMRLRLPASEISSITWRNAAGQISTVAEEEYALKADAIGSFVRFRNAHVLPADLYESEAVSITYTAGYGELVDGQPNPVPGPIRSAILLMVGDLYRFRETAENGGAAAVEMSMTVERLIAPYRRGSI